MRSLQKGEMHVITFRLDIANEKFLKDQTPLLEKGLELLSEIIFSPALEDGAFLPLYVSQEKRTLKQRIQAVYNDKMRYSNLRLIQEMCKDEPYALHVNGELDDVDGITPQSLYEAYQKRSAKTSSTFTSLGMWMSSRWIRTFPNTLKQTSGS